MGTQQGDAQFLGSKLGHSEGGGGHRCVGWSTLVEYGTYEYSVRSLGVISVHVLVLM